MIYNLLRIILYPILILTSIFSLKKRQFFKKRLFQNYEFLSGNRKYIWIHCSSVGEVNLSEGLIRKLQNEFEENILMSVFTDTGYSTAKSRYKNNEKINIIYFPLDDIFLIKKILKKIEVKLLIIVETEIWPNLIKEVSKKSPVVLVNGRISDRSFKRYKILKNILSPILDDISLFFMQSQEDSKRIIELGAKVENVKTIGNLKFDIEFEDYSIDEKNELKDLIGTNGRKIFVAGSTREGEDEQILSLYKKLSKYILVIVPRHLERIESIEKMIIDNGLKYKKLSEIDGNLEDSYEVILVDQMGILRKFYSISDIAFVGGTLVNIGGHSLLEPLFYKKTPIFGPYIQNVKDISKEILEKKIGYKVENEKAFLEAINEVEQNSLENKNIKIFFDENSKAAEKIIDDIKLKLKY
ncbi:3-deoxy-D-manno-octulosonic acid transferase [Cetobacterium sp. 2A]|uniref:3-deoxy-D-manno-octulosonic acid transferase n=1 Tax=Cetobacterium sp. 2A TaxID=2754723 RepID=UPI00163C236A|nr:glycosyltransferase N-terminal domain-containing protein [Cetobacterium sp. 2A]MBC2856466.1 3-deoxy-D-manno-octulosonic acid transferase [Cetobacterium sp. 2A]